LTVEASTDAEKCGRGQRKKRKVRQCDDQEEGMSDMPNEYESDDGGRVYEEDVDLDEDPLLVDIFEMETQPILQPISSMPSSKGKALKKPETKKTTVTYPTAPAGLLARGTTSKTSLALTEPPIQALDRPSIPALSQTLIPTLTRPPIPALNRPPIPALNQTLIPTVTRPSIPALNRPPISALQPDFSSQLVVMMRRLESLMRSMEIVKANQREHATMLDVVVKSTRPPEIDKSFFRTEFNLPMKDMTEMDANENLLTDDLIRVRWVRFLLFSDILCLSLK
jgi:hypothetical protein